VNQPEFETYYAQLKYILYYNPKDRAMRVNRETLEGLLSEMDYVAGQLVEREGARKWWQFWRRR
jgi:hypothetical protein